MKTRALAALALALALASPAPAEMLQKTSPLLVNYDLDATSFTYCKQVGGSVDLVPKDNYQKATTSGSSTTVAAYSASTEDPFANVAVGSVLYFNIPQSSASLAATQGPAIRYVTAKASADSITVNSAIELPTEGVTFQYTTQNCGTAATDGWFGVGGYISLNAVVQIAQLNVTGGIDYELECRTCSGTGLCTGAAVVSGPTNKTAVGTFSMGWSLSGTGQGPWDQCRLGLKIGTSDDGGDTGVDAEQVFLTVTGYR